MLHEVPSRTEVARIPGLKHLASKFHDKRTNWPTIILIGRDCIRAQRQKQIISTHDGHPIASDTPFGWVLIGSGHQNANDGHVVNNVTLPQTNAVVNHVSETNPRQTNVRNATAERYTNTLLQDSERDVQDFIGIKEDELPGYSQDDMTFLQCVLPQVRQRNDGMIEFPLPFNTPGPTFPYNRPVALARTRATLENKRKKHPDVFQSSIDKFAKNLNVHYPRFVPVPKQFQ